MKPVGLALDYTFGKTDNLKIAGITIPKSEQDIRILHFGGDYVVANGVKVGGGYLTGTVEAAHDDSEADLMTDISGVFVQASAELPVTDRLALKGKVVFSPFLSAEITDTNEEKDVTYTNLKIGATYRLGKFDITGGYRYWKFDPDDDESYAVSDCTLSGLYLGVRASF